MSIEARIQQLNQVIDQHRKNKEYYALLFNSCDIDQVTLAIDYSQGQFSYTGTSEIETGADPFLESLTKGYLQHLHEWHAHKAIRFEMERDKLQALIDGRVPNCKPLRS